MVRRMIRIEWRKFQWRPPGPPDLNEYTLLRTLDESGMKQHLKVILAQVREELTAKSPYSYRKSFIGLIISVILITVANVFSPEVGAKPEWCLVVGTVGWLAVFFCVLHGISASLTHDSIRQNLIVAREHYVRCWMAAQKLDFDRFSQHMTSSIARAFPIQEY